MNSCAILKTAKFLKQEFLKLERLLRILWLEDHVNVCKAYSKINHRFENILNQVPIL